MKRKCGGWWRQWGRVGAVRAGTDGFVRVLKLRSFGVLRTPQDDNLSLLRDLKRDFFEGSGTKRVV